MYPEAFDERMRGKLGFSDEQPDDRELTTDLLQLLAQGAVDYTIFWRRLSQAVAQPSSANPWEPVRDLFPDREGFDSWRQRYDARISPKGRAQRGAAMLAVNPAYVLRNHLGEVAIRAAQAKDFSEVDILLRLLQSPFTDNPGFSAHAGFPPDWAASIAISCSS